MAHKHVLCSHFLPLRLRLLDDSMPRVDTQPLSSPLPLQPIRSHCCTAVFVDSFVWAPPLPIDADKDASSPHHAFDGKDAHRTVVEGRGKYRSPTAWQSCFRETVMSSLVAGPKRPTITSQFAVPLCMVVTKPERWGSPNNKLPKGHPQNTLYQHAQETTDEIRPRPYPFVTSIQVCHKLFRLLSRRGTGREKRANCKQRVGGGSAKFSPPVLTSPCQRGHSISVLVPTTTRLRSESLRIAAPKSLLPFLTASLYSRACGE